MELYKIIGVKIFFTLTNEALANFPYLKIFLQGLSESQCVHVLREGRLKCIPFSKYICDRNSVFIVNNLTDIQLILFNNICVIIYLSFFLN